MSHESLAYQQTRRRLLTPDEAMRLPADDALLFAAGHPPVRATKIRYFEDRLLGARARIPAPVLSDVVEPSDDTDASGGTDH
jgi:type IV secretion system protein VirD4